MVQEEILSKLQCLYEEHVFDQTTLAACTLTHDQDRFLCRQQQLHHIIVSDRVIGGDHDVLDQPSRRDHLLELSLHTIDVPIDIKLGPLVGVKVEETVKDVVLVLEGVVRDK